MSLKIMIHSDSTGWVNAEVDEELNPVTAKAIIGKLPFEANTRIWGDEVYFDIPVSVEAENSQVELEIGDLAYWPEGRCFCIFFGRTPASTGEKPAAASRVNRFGRVTDNPEKFRLVKVGETIRVSKVE